MIDDSIRLLAGEANFAAFTTLLPGGAPMTHVMWVGVDDEHVLINTEVHRQKYKNVSADPRVTVTIWDRDNPYRYVEVRGRMVGEVRGPEARDHIDELSRKYTGDAYSNPVQSERVVLRIAPERVRANGL